MAKLKIVAGIVFSVLFLLPGVVVEAAGPKLKLNRKNTPAKATAAPKEPAVLKQAPAAAPYREFPLTRVSSTITTVLPKVAEFPP